MIEKKIKVEVSSHEEMLLFVITGHTSKKNAAAVAQEVFKTLNEQRPLKVLIDCRKVLGRLNIVDTYYHVKDYPLTSYRTKMAVVDIPENKEYYSFHETAATNAGFYITYFNDIDKAMEWLNQ